MLLSALLASRPILCEIFDPAALAVVREEEECEDLDDSKEDGADFAAEDAFVDSTDDEDDDESDEAAAPWFVIFLLGLGRVGGFDRLGLAPSTEDAELLPSLSLSFPGVPLFFTFSGKLRAPSFSPKEDECDVTSDVRARLSSFR
jgi:hypothetical protein